MVPPNNRLFSFDFSKARWDDFAYYFDSHYSLAEKYSSFCLSSAAALFTSLTLHAAKSTIPFGRIKRQLNAWWSAKVKEVEKDERSTLSPSFGC